MRNDCRDIPNFVAIKTKKVKLEGNNSECFDKATTKSKTKTDVAMS